MTRSGRKSHRLLPGPPKPWPTSGTPGAPGTDVDSTKTRTDDLIADAERLRAWLSGTAASLTQYAEDLIGQARTLREEEDREHPGE